MKLVDLQTRLSRREYVEAIRDHNRINEGVKFKEKLGRPSFKVKEKGTRLRLSCTYVGGNSRDDGFLVGTYFIGSLKENADGCRLKGIIVTSPLFHLVLLALTVVFILKCMELGGFSVIPPIFLAMSLFMFKDEYGKQGVIKRYLYRAKIRTENEKL